MYQMNSFATPNAANANIGISSARDDAVFTPPPLTIAYLQFTYRMEAATNLPRWKGALLRGGLGRALRQTLCPTPDPYNQPCRCKGSCAYSALFAPNYVSGEAANHTADNTYKPVQQDPPRAYAVHAPVDAKTYYAAGDTLTFGLMLIGRAIQYTPHIIAAYEKLGYMGLGAQRGSCRLVSVESVDLLNGNALPLLRGGRLHNQELLTDIKDAFALAQHMPSRLKINFPTPMRIKRGKRFHDVPARYEIFTEPQCKVLVWSVVRRLQDLCAAFGDGIWNVRSDRLLALAEDVSMSQCHTAWVDWSRISGESGEKMIFGGFVGSAVYENVPSEIRAVLMAGSLVQTGKATVFGHGQFRVEGLPQV